MEKWKLLVYQRFEGSNKKVDGVTIFDSYVPDSEGSGVMDFDADSSLQGVNEKPATPPSNYVVAGLYLQDCIANLWAN